MPVRPAPVFRSNHSRTFRCDTIRCTVPFRLWSLRRFAPDRRTFCPNVSVQSDEHWRALFQLAVLPSFAFDSEFCSRQSDRFDLRVGVAPNEPSPTILIVFVNCVSVVLFHLAENFMAENYLADAQLVDTFLADDFLAE